MGKKNGVCLEAQCTKMKGNSFWEIKSEANYFMTDNSENEINL